MKPSEKRTRTVLTPQQVETDLRARASSKLRDFSLTLLPTVLRDTLLGVSVPEVRALGKSYLREYDVRPYLQLLPHTYWEERLLHGILLDVSHTYEALLADLHVYLPYINDWALCDTLHPKLLCKHLSQYLQQCRAWLEAEHEYTVRFAIVSLKTYYLNELFSTELLYWIANLNREEYYIRMAQAWFFAEALIKQTAATLPYFTERQIATEWVHNKALQKARESKRIDPEYKKYLQTLKIA